MRRRLQRYQETWRAVPGVRTSRLLCAATHHQASDAGMDATDAQSNTAKPPRAAEVQEKSSTTLPIMIVGVMAAATRAPVSANAPKEKRHGVCKPLDSRYLPALHMTGTATANISGATTRPLCHESFGSDSAGTNNATASGTKKSAAAKTLAIASRTSMFKRITYE